MVKSVLLHAEFLEVRNADFQFFARPQIANLHVHDVFAVLVDFCVNGLLALLDSFLVLGFGLFFLLDDSFDSFVAELGNEFVDASFGVDGEGEIDFEVLLGWVEVLLLECGADETIGDFDFIVNVFERNGDMGFGLDIFKKIRVANIAAAFLEFGIKLMV